MRSEKEQHGYVKSSFSAKTVKHTQKCVKMRRLVIIHVNPHRLCNK